MTEGTWRSSGYRATARAARSTCFLLGLSAVVAALAAASAYLGHDIFDRAVESQSFAEIDDWGGFVDNLAIGQILLLLVTAVGWCIWEYRTVGNVPLLGGGTPKWSPAWSVVWWFVPIAFLFMPFLVIREVSKRLAWTGNASTFMVGAWWIAWIAAEWTDRISGLTGMESIEGVHNTLNWVVLAESLTLLAAVLAILVVRQVEMRANRRAAFAAALAQTQSVPPLGFTTEAPQP